MARLNNEIQCDSDDEEFPDLSIILKRSGEELAVREKSGARGGIEKDKDHGRNTMQHGIIGSPKSVIKTSCDEKTLRKQRPLGHTHVNSLRLPMAKEPVQKSFNRDQHLESSRDGMKRSTPSRAPKARADYRTFSSLTSSEDDGSSDGLSDFIVDDSATDFEEPSSSRTQKPRREVPPSGEKSRSTLNPPVVDFTTPKKSSKTPLKSSNVKLTSQRMEGSGTVFDEDPESCLRFSPPVSHNPADTIRPTTPPSSPSKPRLHSPSKKIRIPPSPHRPSVDAFWSQEVINSWNDQYSPRKTPRTERSGRMLSISEDDGPEPSPSASPQKSPIKSPVKKDKEETQRRKLFNEKKNGLATSFLKDVDEKITNGQVAALAASAGGIQIVWSKKLRSTAGRANWRKETLRTKHPDGSVSIKSDRHHASIELAEKIIDDEDRLFNTIAHEYCHLANFMISGVKDNPHGKEFKEWARKVTGGFSHLAVHVTTKHNYAITYKHIWACTQPECGLEYKRHSRSIDPTRHRCGKCRGSLVQIKPIPRAGAAPAGKSGKDGGAAEADAKGRGGRYQEYVQKHFATVRRENPALGMAGWMLELGRMFREERARGTDLAGSMGGSVSEDASTGVGVGVGIDAEKEKGETTDSVARKLDFLTLSG
ncbi:hypothetical protein MMC29_003643 [Sticta canariensis]|nr:hypothetical protein [Sticta canariensis]